MNRYLSIPLVITLVGFSVAYMSRSSFGEPVVSPANRAIATKNVTNLKAKTKVETNAKAKPPNVIPMTFEDAQVQILDGWPTRGVNHFASRRRLFEPLYAEMGKLAQVDADGQPDVNADSYFCSLTVNAHPLIEQGEDDLVTRLRGIQGIHGPGNSGHFAIHIDRYTKEMNVFADGEWQDYKSWQKTALPKYAKLTGWNQDAPK